MQEEAVNERLKEIKRSFRLLMNGVVAQSMREKGSGYHVNWGASFPMLKDMAAGIGKDYELALALWKENVRECKILATLVMPAAEMTPEDADLWVEQTCSQEIAEMASFNLYQHLAFAAGKAYCWIGSDEDMCRLCGFHTLSLLFKKGYIPDDSGTEHFVSGLIAAVNGGGMAVSKAAMSSAMWFMELGDEHEKLLQSRLKGEGIVLFP